MSRQIIKKKNGRYAIWDSVVDDFIFDNITKKEYIKFRLKEEKNKIIGDLEKTFEAVDNNKAKEIYHQFTLTYKEAVKLKNETKNNIRQN